LKEAKAELDKLKNHMKAEVEKNMEAKLKSIN